MGKQAPESAGCGYGLLYSEIPRIFMYLENPFRLRRQGKPVKAFPETRERLDDRGGRR
jgi:hypothetical protein